MRQRPTGDPDGDAFSNLNEYLSIYRLGFSSTPNVLDNEFGERYSTSERLGRREPMQLIQGLNSMVQMRTPGEYASTFDDDKDGMVDNFDGDGDGDSDCSSDDDDGDGLIDEDRMDGIPMEMVCRMAGSGKRSTPRQTATRTEPSEIRRRWLTNQGVCKSGVGY